MNLKKAMHYPSSEVRSTGRSQKIRRHPIAVPAVCFVLSQFLMPETRKMKNLGAAGDKGVIGDLQDKPGAGQTAPHFFHASLTGSPAQERSGGLYRRTERLLYERANGYSYNVGMSRDLPLRSVQGQ